MIRVEEEQKHIECKISKRKEETQERFSCVQFGKPEASKFNKRNENNKRYLNQQKKAA
jgi:hypothetical protein